MRVVFPEWIKQNETTKYPFSLRATMTNAAGRVIIEGLLLDAALYPIGAQAGLYLSSVTINHQTIALSISDPFGVVASGEIPLIDPPDYIELVDPHGRPAGVLISESRRLGVFQSWGVGTHEFLPEQSEFAATVHFPTPEAGVRGVVLEDGSLFVGDVWLVGGDGVVLRTATSVIAGSDGQPTPTNAIRVDTVGDPLFRRRLCRPQELFATPRFIRRVVFSDEFGAEFTCEPDASGNLQITANNDLAADTVLRIINTTDGIKIRAIGAGPGT